MQHGLPILSITGSDCTGLSGIQADVQTISSLGGFALSVVTTVASGNDKMSDIDDGVVVSQARFVVEHYHPKAVKVGLVRSAEAVRLLRNEIVGCKNIVCAPGVISSSGHRLVDDSVLSAMISCLFPETRLLLLRCNEAEIILGQPINTNEDMTVAARKLVEMGAEWVMLRGGHIDNGRLTALLFGKGNATFFSSYNVDGWQRHGVGGALSAAITTRLGMGDDVPTAVRNAHDFIHSRVVYNVSTSGQSQRPADIYNKFVSLIVEHYTEAHDVGFYADKLAISSRYLSQMTERAVGKSPKLVIADYLVDEARSMLENSRLTVQQIGLHLGFASLSQFCKFFKKHTGRTPSEYRGV